MRSSSLSFVIATSAFAAEVTSIILIGHSMPRVMMTQSASTPVCYETDGGNVSEKAGFAAQKDAQTKEVLDEKADSCTEKVLTEYYCYSYVINEALYTCAYGCKYGACLPAPPEEPLSSAAAARKSARASRLSASETLRLQSRVLQTEWVVPSMHTGVRRKLSLPKLVSPLPSTSPVVQEETDTPIIPARCARLTAARRLRVRECNP